MTQFSDETKQKIVELCKKNKVPELCLFGSRSRGDHRPDSDYDLLVKFLPDPGISLLQYSRMQIDLSDRLRCKVDLVTKRGLKEHVRENVLGDSTIIYEAG